MFSSIENVQGKSLAMAFRDSNSKTPRLFLQIKGSIPKILGNIANFKLTKFELVKKFCQEQASKINRFVGWCCF